MRLEDIPEIPDAGSTQSALANIPEVPDVPAVSGTKHPGLSTLLSQYGLSLQNEAKASAVPGQVLAGVVEPVTLAFPLSIAAGVAERIRRREGEWLPPIIGPGSNEAGESAVKTMRGAQELFSFVPSDPTAAYITEGINNVLGIPALVGGATLKDNREQVIEATKNYPGPMQTAIRILAEGAAQVGQPFRTSMKQYDSPFLSELLGIVPELAAYKGIGGGVSLARKGIGKIRDAVSLHGLENVLDSGQPMPAQAPVAPVKVTAAQARKNRASAKGLEANRAEQLSLEGIEPGRQKAVKVEDLPEVRPVNEGQVELFGKEKAQKIKDNATKQDAVAVDENVSTPVEAPPVALPEVPASVPVPTPTPRQNVRLQTQQLLRMGYQGKEIKGMKPEEMQAIIDRASRPPEADPATVARAQELAAQVDAQAKLGVNQRQAQKIVDDAQQKASAAVAVKDAPPEYLYHATNKEALRGIFEEGLDPLRSAEYEWGDSLGPRISLSADQGMVKDFGNVILRVNKNVLDSAELLDMMHRNNIPEQHYFKNIRPTDIEVLTKDGDWISLRGQKKVVADDATSRQLLTQDEAIPPRPAELDAFEKEMQNEPVPKSAADLFAKDIDTPVEMPADQKAARMQLLRERMSAHQKQFDDGLQRRASQRKAIRGKKEKAEKVTIEEVDKTPEAAMDNMLDETSQAYWEQKLAEEGMPDDLPLSDTMKDDMVIDRDPFTTDRGRRELTFDMLGGQQLYENAVRLIADSPTVQNVCRLAKVAAMQGVKTLGEFRVKAKQVLGDLFDSVAQHLRSAWEAAKRWNEKIGEEVGLKDYITVLTDRRAKLAAQRQARQNNPGSNIVAQITGESGEHALLDNRPVSEGRIKRALRTIGDPLYRYAGTPHEKIMLDAIDAQSIEGFNTANNAVALHAIEAGLSPAEMVNIRQVLEGKPAITPRAAERAQMVRAWLDNMRVRYQDFLKGQIIKGLPDGEARIFKYIIETGDFLGSKQLEWQIYKETGKRTPYDRIIRKIKEYDEVDSWGIDDYVPKVELGTIVLKDAHGNIVAHATNQKDAIEKATRYWESADKPTDLKMDLDPSLYQDLRASLPAKAYHSVARKLSNAIQEQVTGLNKEAAQQLAYKAMKKEFAINPPDVFSPFAEPRRNVLRGEENIIPVLWHYSRMMERKMAYDPVIADIRKTLNSSSKDIKIDKTLREDLETMLRDLKGNYTRQDRILDGALDELFKIVNQTIGTDLTAPTFSYTRALGQFRKGSANAKLGYRLVATGVNRLSGGLHTLAKTGTRTYMEGRAFLKTPEGKALIKEVESRLGTSVIDDTTNVRPATELWKPLGTYQAVEIKNRTECVAANYLYAKKQGMSHEAAKEFAVRQNKIQQFVYNVAALPGWMRGPLARTIFQFKPYLLKEMQFISTLRGAEWARYFTGVMLLGGPRAIMCTLKSLPIIGLMAGWDTLDEAMNKGPWISKISRGIPGLLGLDVSAASSPQFPMSPEDALGPSLSLLADIITFAADMAKGIDVSGKDAAKIMTDYVIVANTVKEAIDLAIDGDGWVKNANGQRMYNVYDVSGTTAEQALDLGSYVLQRQVLGAKPLEMTQMQLADSITRKRDKVDEQNRSIAIRELGAYLVRGKNPPDDLWKHALELGTTADSIVQNVQYRLLDPRTRALLRAELRKKANVLESYPEPEESINPTDLALPGRRQRFLHNFGPAQKGDLQ